MWTTVYMTQNINIARQMREKIENSNILAMLRSICSDDTVGEDCFEILVPRAELNDALDIIINE